MENHLSDEDAIVTAESANSIRSIFNAKPNCVSGVLRHVDSVLSLASVKTISKNELMRRNYLVGSTAGGAGAMLGSRELGRVFPNKCAGIYVVTWNMSTPKPHHYPDDLRDLLFPSPPGEIASIYVICIQELPNEKQELLIRLQAAIGPRHVLFSCAIHGTLGIAVFLARELIWYTSVPQTAGVTTRTAVKTKGAAAVCFILFGSSFLFLSSHFKAHSENHHLRVNDYNNVVSGLSLPRFDLTRGYRQKGQESLDRFDVVFWAGDLNFRIQQPRTIVEQMLKSERRSSLYDNLLCSDELHLARSAGRVFQGFDEGKIKFPPTFKLDPNSDAYDTSDKQRVPSYTDRILFLAHRKGEVTCLHYDSIRTIRSSDHRPVYGFYAVHLKPGFDNIALAAGAFHRDVYIAGNRRRALQFDLTKPRSTSHTKMCRTQ